MLRDLNFEPDVFAVGHINGENALQHARQSKYYSSLYPGKVLTWDFLGFTDCKAEFRNCAHDGGHACFPSDSVLREAEALAEGLQSLLGDNMIPNPSQAIMNNPVRMKQLQEKYGVKPKKEKKSKKEKKHKKVKKSKQ